MTSSLSREIHSSKVNCVGLIRLSDSSERNAVYWRHPVETDGTDADYYHCFAVVIAMVIATTYYFYTSLWPNPNTNVQLFRYFNTKYMTQLHTPCK